MFLHCGHWFGSQISLGILSNEDDDTPKSKEEELSDLKTENDKELEDTTEIQESVDDNNIDENADNK